MSELRSYLEDELQTRRALRKYANLGSFLGGVKDLGKAGVNLAKQNPTATGATVGAGIGAARAEEGKRLKGALIGGALGGTAGKLTQPAARQATKDFAVKHAPTVGSKVGGGIDFVGQQVSKGGKALKDYSETVKSKRLSEYLNKAYPEPWNNPTR